MKKTILLSILIAFMACNKENLVLEAPKSEVDNDEVKVNITITRVDSFGSTKATVKNAFADDDVVFVFFKGVAAPKYLEMKYNSSTGTWTSTAKNGLTSSDISDAADKKMTAIYLPYGSTATVAASEGNFIFSDISYSGYFLKAELVSYTYVGDVLSGTLNMTAPTLSNGSDKLIHFDISGFTSGHNYKLFQDYVKPLTFTSVSSAGVLTIDEGTMGAAITGYEDGSMMSFSGILDASAVVNAVDYQFTIDDLTSSMLYTRDAGIKTMNSSKYIGIGAINNAEVWNAFEYVDLGLSARWAKYNVGSTTPEGYGDYYAWGETEPYYEPGYAQENPQNHWRTGLSDGYIWVNYKFRTSGNRTQWVDNLKLSKYVNRPQYGTIDGKETLDLEDDVAHIKWNGKWRMPTSFELSELDGCTWTWDNENGINGYRITSNRVGYEGNSIFLPAAGSYIATDLVSVGSGATYWSSSLAAGAPYSVHTDRLSYCERNTGRSVRPVYPLGNSELVTSLTIDKDELLMAINEECCLMSTIMVGDEIVDYPITWTSSNTSVATVSSEGLVTALSEGTATITARCRNKGVTCSVVVEHELVDLGLSVKWATYNVGATAPEEYGNYYAWGEIETKSDYSWSTYKFGGQYYITKYNDDDENGIVDNKYELESEDDVAHTAWGSVWRMPSIYEYNELINNCDWLWTTLNGVNGYLVTSKKVGYTDRSIFLPAGGFYFDSTGIQQALRV